MGRMSDLQIEREGVVNMMTNLDLAKELHQRLDSEFSTLETDEEAMKMFGLLSELGTYIREEEKKRGKK